MQSCVLALARCAVMCDGVGLRNSHACVDAGLRSSNACWHWLEVLSCVTTLVCGGRRCRLDYK